MKINFGLFTVEILSKKQNLELQRAWANAVAKIVLLEVEKSKETKRANDLDQSIKNIRADFPQQTAKFTTPLGSG